MDQNPKYDAGQNLWIRVILRNVLCIYTAVTIPLRFAFIPEFGIDLSSYGPFLVLDLMSSLYFIVDAISSFCNEDKAVQIAPMEDAEQSSSSHDLPLKAFRKRWYDLIVAIFSSLLFEYITIFPALAKSWVPNYLMANRIVRIFYLSDYFEQSILLFERNGVLINSGMQRAWKLFSVMAYTGHVCCCGFFYIAKMQAAYGSEYTWVEELEIIQSNDDGNVELLVSVAEGYVDALYWAYITMITTGFGDIVPLSIPETMWCMFTMILGVTITACAIANLQLVVTNADAALTNFQSNLQTVSKYMRYRQLPHELQNRITSFHHYQWDLLRGADEERFLNELPKSLQQQVSNFMCRDLIASLPLLRKANTALLNALSDCVEINLYSPGDNILKFGDQIRGTLLISRGEVEVLVVNSGRVERKMKRFDTYAEESLFVKKSCEKNVVARTFSEIFMLPFESFQQIIKSHCDKNQINQMRETAVTIAKNSKKANKLFGSGEDAIPMSRMQLYSHPQSRFRVIWDFACLLGYLFYAFSLPLMIMRYLDGQTFEGNILSFLLNYIVDSFFLVNLYLRFNSFMYLEEGLLIFDEERIRDRFMRERNLKVEIMTVIPFDFLGFFFTNRSLFLLRLSKIACLPHILKSMDEVSRHLSDFRVGGDLVTFKVITLNFVLLMVCHWVGTTWHGCADLSKQFGKDYSWTTADEDDETLAISHSDLGGFGGYLRSVYWAIVGMSTVGYGDIVPTNIIETTFATIVILFGGLILPAVVGGLAAYLGNVNVTKTKYKRKVATATLYMKHCMMDKLLVKRIQSYYGYLWSRQDAIDEESIMDEFPWPLRQQVAIHLHRYRIDTVPFFASCEESIKELIVSILKPRIFMPMDIVIHKGEIGTSMFFVEKGKVAIIADDGMAFCVLEEGDYFGESSLISSTVLTSSAKTLTYCDVFVLQKDDFNTLMEEFVSQEKQDEISLHMKNTMKQKMELNNSVTLNLIERPKCCSLVSRIDTSNVKVEDDEWVRGSGRVQVLFYPDSTFRLVWNTIMVIICIYNAWDVPFRLVFDATTIYKIDWLFDFLLIMDIYFNNYRFPFLRAGEVIDSIEKIKKHYLQTRFKMDIVMTFPYDLAYFFLSKTPSATIIAICRAPRLLWLMRLPKLLSDIFDALGEFDINLAPFRLVEFLSGVVLIAHWAACGFYAFAQWKYDMSTCDGMVLVVDEIMDCRWKNTWIQRQIINGKLPSDGGTILQRYIRSFNWALPTLVVVVIGDVVPVTSGETLYIFMWMILGVTINAAIIGNVANIVVNIDSDSSVFFTKTDDIKNYMFDFQISKQLQNKVDCYLASLWDHRATLVEESFVQGLPLSLRIQATESTRQRHISSCPFFDFCSSEIVKTLSLRLKLLLFSAGDIIIHYGDMGAEMYFLERGTVDVVSGDGETVFATLAANTESMGHRSAFFGETALFFKQKRNSTVRATSFCEVYELHKKCLDDELKQRDFDLNRMLKVFTKIADSNKQRNHAVMENLKLSKSIHSKLNKMIDLTLNATSGRKINPYFIPNSIFRTGWDLIRIVLVVYIIVVLPFRAAFHDEHISGTMHSLLTWHILDFCIDGFFIVDIYCRNFLFPITVNGVIIINKDTICERYKQNGRTYDLLASLPFELLLLLIEDSRYLLYLRLFHMIRIINLPSYLTLCENYLNLYNIRINAAKKLLMKMFFCYVLVNHWCACIWFMIHRYLERHTQYTWATTDCPEGQEPASNGCLAVWNENTLSHNVCDGNQIHKCYIRSIYFVLTTTSTVGYGDISPVNELETVFQNVVVLTGACFLAGFIGSFGEYLSHNDESGQSAYKLKVQKLQDYMKYRNLPHSLQNEILFFHHNKWVHSNLLNESEVISILPVPLQMDLSFEILQPLIYNIPILRDTKSVVQKRISHRLVRQVSPQGATIYNAGDIGWDIYFINSGLIEIEIPTDLKDLGEEGKANFNSVKAKAASVGLLYKPGNHFGESCITSQTGVRQESVKVKTVATLYHISKESLETIFGFMSSQDRSQLKHNLVSRNGNVWHSFESLHPEREVETNSARRQSKSPSYITSKSDRFTVIQAQRSRRSVFAQTKKQSGRRRLRSFSAEASTQAIKNRIPRNNFAGSMQELNEDEQQTMFTISSCVEAASKLAQFSNIEGSSESSAND